MKVAAHAKVKVADEVWIATALLHREQPQREDFSIEAIVERAAREAVAGVNRPGVYVHVVQHCVANRAPNPGRYRMLLETAPGRRRLFRKGDSYNPGREGAKVIPNPNDIPEQYRGLLDWYRGWSDEAVRSKADTDPLLAWARSHKGEWTREQCDQWVRELREGWE